MSALAAPLPYVLLCAALFVLFGLMRRRRASRTESCSTCASDCELKGPSHGNP